MSKVKKYISLFFVQRHKDKAKERVIAKCLVAVKVLHVCMKVFYFLVGHYIFYLYCNKTFSYHYFFSFTFTSSNKKKLIKKMFYRPFGYFLRRRTVLERSWVRASEVVLWQLLSFVNEIALT